MAVAKLRNVRLIFPKMWSPNDKGKYLCGILIEKDSPAYTELMRAIKEAWAAGRQKFGGTSFCENPTLAQVMNRAYLKADGGLDSKGNPVPEYYAGCIGFTGNSRKPIPVIDVTGAPVAEGDQRVYDGQKANVSVDVSAVCKDNNPCIGRYIRSVMILSGGERIDTGFGDNVSAQDEWASEIQPGADAFGDIAPF